VDDRVDLLLDDQLLQPRSLIKGHQPELGIGAAEGGDVAGDDLVAALRQHRAQVRADEAGGNP
jgi:hypothetical protein